LPKYSPEFNPVELFWRFLKENLRHLSEASTFGNLEEKVVEITASVPLDYVFGWYLEAITKWNNPKKN
jgi:transposase